MTDQNVAVQLPDIASWLHWSGLKVLEAESDRLCAANPGLQILGFDLDTVAGEVSLIARGDFAGDDVWSLTAGRLISHVEGLQAVHGDPPNGSRGLVLAGVDDAGSLLVVDLVRVGRLGVRSPAVPVEMLRSWIVQALLGAADVAATPNECALPMLESTDAIASGVLVTDLPTPARPGLGIVELFRAPDTRDMVLVSDSLTVFLLADREYRLPYAFGLDDQRWAAVRAQLPAPAEAVVAAAEAADTIAADNGQQDVTFAHVNGHLNGAIPLAEGPAPSGVVDRTSSEEPTADLPRVIQEVVVEPSPVPVVAVSPPAAAVIAVPAAHEADEDVTSSQVDRIAEMATAQAPAIEEPGAEESELAREDVTSTQVKPSFTATDKHIWVSVIGPIKVETPSGRTASALNGAGRTDRTTELIARIALSPKGLSNDEIDETLWPESGPAPETRNKQRNVTLSKTRAFLGRPRGGEDPLPRTGEVVRTHPDILSDWDVFQSLVPAIPAQASTESLARAIMLLRGQPLEDAPAGAYEWSAHVRDQMLDHLADAALELSSRLEQQSPGLAMHAAGAGLKVNPDRQDLWSVMLRLAPDDQKASVLSRLSQQIPPNEMTSELKSLIRKVKSQ